MYALDGSEAAPEQDLTHLAGYGDAKPVRVGNAAREQIQLDIYGELFDSIYLANKYGTAMSRESWQHAVATVDFVARRWRDPDAGIWEVRGVPREYLHSRLMCWVALDRASRLARKRSLSAPIERWTAERDRIADDIWENFRHPQHGYFVQSRGSTELDAALLMMPLVRFVSASDPVWLLTLDAIAWKTRGSRRARQHIRTITAYLDERFQSSNYMKRSKLPQSGGGEANQQLSGFMESLV
jgi:GH15 family glucan-1,4-alpha-glucosidase